MSEHDAYGDGPHIRLFMVGVFLVIVVGGVVDLILDRPTTLWSVHVLFEVLMVAVSLGAASYLAAGWYLAESRRAASEEESERLLEEREEWERRASELLEGLGAAISEQFLAWGLTPAESRVALMLLKGFSHKRIARTTGTSERTIRQHSVAVYRKSGLAGRAALAGFFLETLLLPEDLTSEARDMGATP
jgi:DNA-binding NarL/FixJ family response regulator